MMKKRNGFTLLELLAVIVILAVLALISLPMILNVIESSKKGAFRDSIYGIIRSLENYNLKEWIENQVASEITFTYVHGKEMSSIDGKVLEYKGTKPQSGMITIKQNGQIKITNLSDGIWCANKDYDEEEVAIVSCGNIEEVPEEPDVPIITNGPIAHIIANERVVTYKPLEDSLYNINGTYYYRGENPNNYIRFNDEVWRILHIGQDGCLKIIRTQTMV